MTKVSTSSRVLIAPRLARTTLRQERVIEGYGRALLLRVAEALPVVVVGVYAAQRAAVRMAEMSHPVVQLPRQLGRVTRDVLHRAVYPRVRVYGLPQGQDAVERQRAVLEAVMDVVRGGCVLLLVVVVVVVLLLLASRLLARAELAGCRRRRRRVQALGLVPGVAEDRDHGDGATAEVLPQRQYVTRVPPDDQRAEVREPEDLIEGHAGEVRRGVHVPEDTAQGARHGQRGAVEKAVRVLEGRRRPQLAGPGQRQPPPGHVRLARVRQEPEAEPVSPPAAAATVVIPVGGAAAGAQGGVRVPQPLADLVVALEAVRVAARQLAHADEAGVRVLVVAVPEAAAARLLGQVPEGVGDQLDGGRGVGHEDEVEVPGVGAEVPQRLLPHAVDHVARELRRRVGAVRVAVEVGGEPVGEALY
ncbi:hypothetical protein VM1G_11382 [Cytospora mali]|uniref:Uncharacterized protein n=1 Tax=Cytospora mali TaxID=578113 RepID=A0A194VQQ3_CYTMA|nr:hypothetical protein VM1G_11382 [Valsa mali]